ncbi:hypothetical protein N9N67_03700 [Bacteriovoracaceae bacterium]|nr:hypothetical protein [Bacteriovoracaceae bacterium]
MEQLLELIQNTPPDQFYIGLFGLIYVTGLGVLPNSTDVNMLILGSFIAEDKLPFSRVWIICCTALILADHTTFILSKWFGTKVLNLKWIKKILKAEIISAIQALFKISPLHPILAIRLAPTGRPPLIVLLSSLGYPLKLFSPIYTPFVILHTFVVIGISYQLNLYAKEYLGDFKLAAVALLIVLWILLMKKISVKLKQIIKEKTNNPI